VTGSFGRVVRRTEGIDPALAALAAELGIVMRYTDIYGAERSPPQEAILAVLRSLGAPVERVGDCEEVLRARAGATRGNPVAVAWNGEITHVAAPDPGCDGPVRLRIRLEDGTERQSEVRGEPGPRRGLTRYAVAGPLPIGIHDVEVEAAGRLSTTRVLSAPRIAWLPPRPRSWGLFLPLHGYGPEGTPLPATYADLKGVLDWVGRTGGSYVATLPLLPTFLDRPYEPSPYAPLSRLFLNELFVDPAAAAARVGDPTPMRLEPPDRSVFTIDYRLAWQRLRALLDPTADRFFGGGGARAPQFQRFLLNQPAAQDYARFRAAAAREGRPWREWPARMAAGRLQRGDYDPADYRFHLFAAWCAEEQMAAATSEDAAARLYLDLPLGVHPDGYDTWRLRHLFADGVTAGAPPDTFFERGQNWGFPPLRPDAMRADGYRYVVECLRLQLRFAGALRLDHVMALERIFWVPAGFDASDGVYVRYPREELAALLTLESHRHGTMIVGEDLGTVTPSIRRTMEEHAIQRMFVVQFEVDPDRSPPLSTPGPDAVASLNTHDLPTFAAWLPGTDLEERVWLGHLDRDAAEVMRGQRQRTVRSLCRSLGLAEDPPAPQATLEAVLERLAGGPARLVMVNAEDAWLETRQQNVPGTTTERSNWQSRTPFAAFSLATDPQLADLLELVNRGRADRVASPTGDP